MTKIKARIRRGRKYFYFNGEHRKKSEARSHKNRIKSRFPKHNVRVIKRTRKNKKTGRKYNAYGVYKHP